MILHQILINDFDSIPSVLPNYTVFCQNELKRIYSDFDYCLWSNVKIKEFLKKHFDKGVVSAYNKLKPYSYKSDLARFCILYELGGIYVDINTRFLNPIQHLSNALYAFRDYSLSQRRGWYVSTSIIFSEPNNAILKTCIETILKNVSVNYYGETPLDPTGPGVLGQSIIDNPKNLSDNSGEIICITPMHENKTLAFVQDSGNIVALRKPNAPGDLTFFGFRGVNNYKEMWEQKNIYHDT